MVVKSIPEAPESNAGDDFHRLWAARRALDLLTFDDEGLKKLVVEDIGSQDANQVDQTGEKLLAVDLTEYFGGKDFINSNRTVISQLKYSTRRAQKPYTLARLCEKRKKKQSGAIIAKLAKAFNAFYNEFGREKVISKLEIRLTSNRPIAPEFLSSLKSIQNFLITHEGKISQNELQKVCSQEKGLISTLYSAVGIGSFCFTDFLRVLNFDDCGSGSRFYHRSKLVREVSLLGTSKAKYNFGTLYLLMNSLMMPENRGRSEICREDVILELGLGASQSLFPVPAKFEDQDFLIERESAVKLSQEIIRSQEQLVFVQGDAGVGKSTTIRSFQKYLPEGSKVFHYDCYGQGDYMNSDQLRHKHNNAFLQMINELARELGTSLLLVREQAESLYIQDFKDRLSAGIEVIRKVHPDALLVFVIDAADNSLTAAQSKGHNSFVHDLIGVSNLPEGCKLVFTTRKARMASLNPPSNALTYSLEPFSLDETSQFIRHHYPEVGEEQIDKFHDLTGGIPRVQNYALHEKGELVEVFDFLMPYGHSVGTLIQGQLEEAQKRAGLEEKVQSILKMLVALPRPIPLSYGAEVCLISTSELRDFCIDLSSGLIISNTDSTVAFRDEDFENHIIENYSPNKEDYQQIADSFLSKANEDYYASFHLAEALFRAGKHKELQSVVLEKSYLGSILDPLAQREVFINRTRLAMLNASDFGHSETFFKLLIIAAEAAKINNAQLEIINNNVDLITAFGDLKTIQNLFFDITKNPKYGAANWVCARALSRLDSYENYAQKHLDQAESWLRKRKRSRDDEDETVQEKYPIKHKDIYAGTEAVLRLHGLKKANHWVRRWRPRNLMLPVLKMLVESVVQSSKNLECQEWFAQIPRADVRAIALIESFKTGRDYGLDPDKVVFDVTQILKRGVSFDSSFYGELLEVCQIALFTNGFDSSVELILDHVKVPAPEHHISFHTSSYGDNLEKFDQFFKHKCLTKTLKKEAIKLDDFYPASLINGLKTTADEDRKLLERSKELKKGLDRIYSVLFPIYQLSAEVICGKPTSLNIDAALDLVERIERDYELSYVRRIDYRDILNFAYSKLIELTLYVPNKEALLQAIEKKIAASTKSYLAIRFELADAASRIHETNKLAYQVLSSVDSIVAKQSVQAKEKIESYEKCAGLCQNMLDYNEAKIYFDKAVEAASSIDLEVFDQIPALNRVSERLPSNNENPELAYEIIKFVEYSSICLGGYDHFPWSWAFDTIRNVDFNSSLAIWCRWDHRNIDVDSDVHFTMWSETLHKSLLEGRVSVCQAMGLSAVYLFDHDWLDLVDLIIEKLITENNYELLDKYLHYINRDVSTFCAQDRRLVFIEKLQTIFKKYRLEGNRWCQDLNVLGEFLSHKQDKLDVQDDYEKLPIEEALNKLILVTEPDDSQGINIALEELNVHEKVNYRIRSQDFFDGLRAKCKPNTFVGHLDSLLSIKPGLVEANDYLDALKACLNEWSFKQEVLSWKNRNFSIVVEKIVLEMDSRYQPDSGLDIYVLNQAKEIFNKSETELARALQLIFPKIVSNLPSKSIYESFGVFKHLLPESEAQSLLTWFTLQLNHSTPANTADGEWHDSKCPDRTTSKTYSDYLRFQLGHPDKTNRWNALNAILRCVEFSDITILDNLFYQRDNRQCMAFQDSKYVFYWLSSKMWLFFGLDKIATNNPGVLNNYFDELYKEATQKVDQHVLIRWLARSICQKMLIHDKSLISEEERIALDSVLTQQDSEQDRLEAKAKLEAILESTEEPLFHFDHFDTESYWYRDLASLFGLKVKQISILADRFIQDYFHYKGNPREDDHVKLSDHEYHLMSNDHGSVPQVENLRIYLESHSMFLVANQLFESLNLEKSSFDDEESWVEWLFQWCTTWGDGHWLQELRNSTPQEERYWSMPKPYSKEKEWKYGITSEYLDEVSGLIKFDSSDLIKVYSNEEINDSSFSEKVRTVTALASAHKADSLVRALQTAAHSQDYGFPFQDDSRLEITDAEFQLLPFLNVQDNVNSKGVDQFDRLSGELAKVKVVPCDDFIISSNGTISPDGCHVVNSDDSDRVISMFENWTDYNSNYQYRSGSGSNGNRLFVKKSDMLSYLKEKGMSLIFKCQVSRHIYDRHGLRDTEYYDYNYSDEYTKIFLITSNGQIQTYRGAFEARK